MYKSILQNILYLKVAIEQIIFCYNYIKSRDVGSTNVFRSVAGHSSHFVNHVLVQAGPGNCSPKEFDKFQKLFQESRNPPPPTNDIPFFRK